MIVVVAVVAVAVVVVVVVVVVVLSPRHRLFVDVVLIMEVPSSGGCAYTTRVLRFSFALRRGRS